MFVNFELFETRYAARLINTRLLTACLRKKTSWSVRTYTASDVSNIALYYIQCEAIQQFSNTCFYCETANRSLTSCVKSLFVNVRIEQCPLCSNKLHVLVFRDHHSDIVLNTTPPFVLM